MLQAYIRSTKASNNIIQLKYGDTLAQAIAS
jgi:hypothetical protein